MLLFRNDRAQKRVQLLMDSLLLSQAPAHWTFALMVIHLSCLHLGLHLLRCPTEPNRVMLGLLGQDFPSLPPLNLRLRCISHPLHLLHLTHLRHLSLLLLCCPLLFDLLDHPHLLLLFVLLLLLLHLSLQLLPSLLLLLHLRKSNEEGVARRDPRIRASQIFCGTGITIES